MHFIGSFSILYSLSLIIINQAAKQCHLPNGGTGDCIKMSSCEPIQDLYTKKHKSDDEKLFLKQSYCTRSTKVKSNYPGYRSTIRVRPRVCCPSSESWDNFQPTRNRQKLLGPTEEDPDVISGDTTNCGEEISSVFRITGGAKTAVDQYPWLVLLEYGNGILGCGGSLISSKLVLTAAHCINVNLYQPVKARLSEYNTSSYPTDIVPLPSGGFEQITVTIIPVDGRIVHPQFDRNRMIHDIGILRLAQPAVFNDFIKIICLPARDLTVLFTRGTTFTVAGWGDDPQNLNNRDIKKHVVVPYVPIESCRQSHSEKILDTQICAGGEEGKDTCQGDSGGPLMYQFEQRTILVGVTSFGPKYCGTKDLPAIYTNVYKYLNWVTDVLYGRISFKNK